MPEAFFILYGPGPSRVGRVAESLHRSFVGVKECPQGAFPQVDGRRWFCVTYDDIDPQDVEMFRQQLEQALNSLAWSIKIDTDGKVIFTPPLDIRRSPPPPAPGHGRTEQDDPPPRTNHFPSRPYADDYEHGEWEWDWDWDYPGQSAYSSAYDHGGGYEDYPDPSSHHNRRRSSFAANYDRHNTYDDYYEPPPFHNSRRNTYQYNNDPNSAYQGGYEPSSSHHQSRRGNTFPSNHGTRYHDNLSHASSSRNPHARTNNHGTHHRDDHQSHRSSHTHHYDRTRYTEVYQQHGGHSSSSRTQGRNRYTDAATSSRAVTRAVAQLPRKKMGKGLSRKFWKMISAFVMYATT